MSLYILMLLFCLFYSQCVRDCFQCIIPCNLPVLAHHFNNMHHTTVYRDLCLQVTRPFCRFFGTQAKEDLNSYNRQTYVFTMIKNVMITKCDLKHIHMQWNIIHICIAVHKWRRMTCFEAYSILQKGPVLECKVCIACEYTCSFNSSLF